MTLTFVAHDLGDVLYDSRDAMVMSVGIPSARLLQHPEVLPQGAAVL